jgi:hypothetical protein
LEHEELRSGAVRLGEQIRAEKAEERTVAAFEAILGDAV